MMPTTPSGTRFCPIRRPFGRFFHSQHFPDWVVQFGYLTHAFCHCFNPAFVQKEPVQKSLRHAFFFSMLHIQRIGRDNRFGVCHKVFRCFFQHTVFLLRLHDSKHRLRLAGSRSDFFQLHHTRLLLVLSYRNWLNGKSSALSPASAAEHPSLQTAPHQTAETQTPLQPL